MSLEAKLAAGLEEQGVEVNLHVRQKLLDYLALLAKWNRVHNLTAVRDPEDMVTLHLLDSLSVLPYLYGTRLLDVGSGAGLPGIPLALVRPDLQVTVLDSSHKKASFMRQSKAALEIRNLEVVCGRVEDFKPESKYDTVISRAFSDLSEFVRLTRHLRAETGIWLAMKGVYPYGELEQIQGLEHQIQVLHVPGLDAQRHLVILKAA